LFGRGVAWLDAGTHESLLQASAFIQTVQERQGLMISCPEEIAYRMEFISKEQLLKLGQELSSNSYGQYILDVAKSAK
jgi:glucose-1-phosphate thymidylyltransferase